jgi:predicted CopG family antitoxin
MPEQGYKSITVSEDIYSQLQQEAEKDHRSVSNFIEALLILWQKKKEAA